MKSLFLIKTDLRNKMFCVFYPHPMLCTDVWASSNLEEKVCLHS